MPVTFSPADLELWGGVECTINRVGDRYLDQLQRGGHAQRLEDLDRIAELGIKRLRYPVLWEMLAPEQPDEIDWAWADERLGRLRELGIEPIVGLVHHGSGPRYTDLLDPAFPELLASFAGKVAARYPWIRQFTPVNEPLTTARFSGLYGHWYPHGTDARTFATILLNELRAVTLAMRAIRAVIPEAQLVQTEDLGQTFSSPELQYQADFENDRRWLTFDLLAGKVDRDHPMAHYFRFLGLPDESWRLFAEEPCPADLLGINYYVTSERYLDGRLDFHHPDSTGGNGRDRYADVAAVRGRPEGIVGLQTLLGETWSRYQQPIAVTECHLGCTREEQMRWLRENWEATCQARTEGVDVRALTVWSLLGAWEWNSLLTRAEGHYEPGAFDLRSPEPRPTALAQIARSLATGQPADHPLLVTPGWWHRDIRRDFGAPPPFAESARTTAPILFLRPDRSVAEMIGQLCELRGLQFAIRPGFEALSVKPWAIVDCAGLGDGDPFLPNATLYSELPFAIFSREQVFDGQQSRPNLETDLPQPATPRGQQLLDYEKHIAHLRGDRALIARTGPTFSETAEHGFAPRILTALLSGRPVYVSDRATFSPTYLPDLLQTLLDLLIDGEKGPWHLANPGFVTEFTFAQMLATAADLPLELVRHSEPNAEAAPNGGALDSARGRLLPPLQHAVGAYVRSALEGLRHRLQSIPEDRELAS